MSRNSCRSSGVGFTGLLTLLFIGLKLTGQITWPWWGVLAPLWLPITVICGGTVIFSAFCLLMAGFCELMHIADRSLRKSRKAHC